MSLTVDTVSPSTSLDDMYDDQLFTVIKRDTCMAYPTCSLMLYFCCGVCWVRSMPVGINYYSDARFRIDAHETDAL